MSGRCCFDRGRAAAVRCRRRRRRRVAATRGAAARAGTPRGAARRRRSSARASGVRGQRRDGGRRRRRWLERQRKPDPRSWRASSIVRRARLPYCAASRSRRFDNPTPPPRVIVPKPTPLSSTLISSRPSAVRAAPETTWPPSTFGSRPCWIAFSISGLQQHRRQRGPAQPPPRRDVVAQAAAHANGQDFKISIRHRSNSWPSVACRARLADSEARSSSISRSSMRLASAGWVVDEG